MSHVLQLMAARTPPPDDVVGPGVGGFLVIFALALATILLIRSMVGHLRKVRYSPEPDAGETKSPDDAQNSDGAEDAGRTGEHREGV